MAYFVRVGFCHGFLSCLFCIVCLPKWFSPLQRWQLFIKMTFKILLGWNWFMRFGLEIIINALIYHYASVLGTS